MTFPLDTITIAILGFLAAAWLVSGWVIENPPSSRPSVSALMQDFRRDWMRTFVTRQPGSSTPP